jgi:hypothetical protein
VSRQRLVVNNDLSNSEMQDLRAIAIDEAAADNGVNVDDEGFQVHVQEISVLSNRASMIRASIK